MAMLTSGGTIAAVAGGAVLGTVSVATLGICGRILGISGVIKGAVVSGDTSGWRVAFVAGLLGAGAAAAAVSPATFTAFPASYTLARAAAGGLLVGLGAGLGNGCTSGHGICGMARRSVRSLVYTLTFMALGAAAATLTGSAAALGIPTTPPPSTPFSSLPASAILPYAAALTAGGLPALLLAARALPASVVDTAAELWAGLTFGLGLVVSGMVQPAKVVAFLSPFSPFWDPSLMFVMATALLITAPGFHLLLSGAGGQKKPVLCEVYNMPTRTSIDTKLVLGGVLFGAGWGVSGMCPGPALVALAAVPGGTIAAYLGAMMFGLWVQQFAPL